MMHATTATKVGIHTSLMYILFRLLGRLPFGPAIAMTIERMFRSKRMVLLLALLLSSMLGIAMVALRIHLRKFDVFSWESWDDFLENRDIRPTFIFFIWNLILAWIPFGISSALRHLESKGASTIALCAVGAAWLLFFPNAPYIVTDLMHLKERDNVPYWYDILMFFTFAWTGLILGFASLRDVHIVLFRRLPRYAVWPAIAGLIALCSFGVYLGRYQRWNSWDIVSNPFSLIETVAYTLLHPNLSTIGVTALLTAFLSIGYLKFWALHGE